MKTRTKIAGALLACMMMGAGGAQAVELRSSTTGVNGYSGGNNAQVSVGDTANDSHAVYVLYTRAGSSQARLNNTSGAGNTVKSSSGATIRVINACVDIQLNPDRCGGPS